jgi:hypothetical protein
MDLMRRDANFQKISVIRRPLFQSNSGFYGSSKNDFQLTLSSSQEELRVCDLITYDTSEFGGVISQRIHRTGDKTITYTGRTFRGQMECSIVNPLAVLTLTGTDFDIISELFNLSQLDYKIAPTGRTEQKTVTVPLGSNLLKAADLVMAAFGEKMKFKVSNAGVEISLEKVKEHSFDSAQTELTVDENFSLPTALHVMGKVNRVETPVSVYVDYDGNIASGRVVTGAAAVEIWQVLNDNCETVEQLTQLASDRLLALRKSQNASEVNIKIEDADIGDIVTASIKEYGIKAVQTVSEKILKIENKTEIITFNTGG